MHIVNFSRSQATVSSECNWFALHRFVVASGADQHRFLHDFRSVFTAFFSHKSRLLSIVSSLVVIHREGPSSSMSSCLAWDKWALGIAFVVRVPTVPLVCCCSQQVSESAPSLAYIFRLWSSPAIHIRESIDEPSVGYIHFRHCRLRHFPNVWRFGAHVNIENSSNEVIRACTLLSTQYDRNIGRFPDPHLQFRSRCELVTTMSLPVPCFSKSKLMPCLDAVETAIQGNIVSAIRIHQLSFRAV